MGWLTSLPKKIASFLCIPPDIPFQVEPRLKVTKNYLLSGSRVKDVTELLFKVWWYTAEPNCLGVPILSNRAAGGGHHPGLDWETRQAAGPAHHRSYRAA